jgi:hypothetical protein
VNVKILIDCIVRQTTVLLAQLATARGVRAPLAHVASQVFLDLSRELEAQGISRKVSADMFGMALRTYQRRIQWLSESVTDRGRTLWEAILDYLSEGQVHSRAQVLRRFSRDDPALVRGVLFDLTESGLLFSSGSGSDQVYRATTQAEQMQLSAMTQESGLEELVWAHIYRNGPATREGLEEFAASNPKQLVAALDRLISLGRVQVQQTAEGPRYSATSLEVLLGDAVGWEAAVYDHYHALVRTIGQRLAPESSEDVSRGWVGGSTFTFDVWDGHPLADEVRGQLARFRATTVELYERVEAYNREHGLAPSYDEIVLYAGQSRSARDRSSA